MADVNTVLNVSGEMFDVRESEPSDGVHAYHFTWTNGPEDYTYGFSLGGSNLTAEQLERAAPSLFSRSLRRTASVLPTSPPFHGRSKIIAMTRVAGLFPPAAIGQTSACAQHEGQNRS